jgi:hypothetical protein
MRPTSGTRVTDPSSSAAAGPTPHPSPREEPQEISLEEIDFIKNLKEEDIRSWSANGRQYQVIKSMGCENGQISLIGDEQFICNNNQWAGPIGKKLSDKDDKTKPILNEKMLAQIESDVASAWEEARKKIANMSEAELSAMYAGFAQPSLKDLFPELFDDEDLIDSSGSSLNLKKQQALTGLKDTNLVKNVEETAEVKQIWDDYEKEVFAIKVEYKAGIYVALSAYYDSPGYAQYKAAYLQYYIIYLELKAIAETAYDEAIAALPDIRDDAILAAFNQYDLDMAAAVTSADETAAFSKLSDAIFKAQIDYDDGPALAEATKEASISSAWKSYLSLSTKILKDMINSDTALSSDYKAKNSKIAELKAAYNEQLLEAEQERDAALAALKS